MTAPSTPIFDADALPTGKSDRALTTADEQHLQRLAASLATQLEDLRRRLDEARRAPGRGGTAAVERDQEIHRLSQRIRTLERYGVDLCLGRMVPDDGGPAVYVGRLGLSEPAGDRLLVDWRSPSAEPFFGATHARPMGLASRRRYRWDRERITDFWDEAFTDDALADADSAAAFDDQSAFLATLGASRSARMRDVLGTIATDQDAIIRAPSRGALVVDGGPGTGKTVVALHRAAYLRYADPLLGDRRGGVLVIGPHRPYLRYVADVLPSLGEEGVQTCTLADLVPEGAAAVPETDPEVEALKSRAEMVAAVAPAIRISQDLPRQPLEIETAWGTVRLRPADWAEAFAAPEDGTPHNDAREVVRAALLGIAVDAGRDLLEEDEDPAALRRALAGDRGFVAALNRAWPVLEAPDVVADLWSVPALLRHCAPWLSAAEVASLQRDDPRAWTTADLPLLDAARALLGDPGTAARRRRDEAAQERRRAEMADVVSDLLASDDSELQVMSMLRGADLQAALAEGAEVSAAVVDRLAGPFGHVVVDEAQELTDAQWQMVRQRCPSGSLTVVGDRAQARRGFTETWEERLARVGVRDTRVATLTTGYRTPTEVMAVAEPEIRAAIPDANVPTSIRSTGLPVRYGDVADLDDVLEAWLAAHDGVACVIGTPAAVRRLPDRDRVQALTPTLAKGLELDLVVLLDPDRFGDGVQGAVDRYVAMTRSTRELVVLTS